MNIVIIEDEALTVEDLRETLIEIDEQINVIKVLPSAQQAIDFFKKNTIPIQLIFSDIQLQDGLSFQIFKSIAITTPVVFCTAYNEYALHAFDSNGIDYILKPFSTETIEKALNKYKNLKNSLSKGIDTYEKVIALLEKQHSPKSRSVLVHHKDKIIPISTDDIAVFYILNEVVHLRTFDGKNYTVSYTMEETENRVGISFFRANRQFLVHRNAVADAAQHFARKMVLHLNIPFEEEIILSKTRVPLFLDWLQGE